MREPKIERYQDRSGAWRARIKAANGEQLARSAQGYPTLAALNTALDRAGTASAAVQYTDAAGEWRWRIADANGALVIASEGYVECSSSYRGAKMTIQALAQ